MNTADLESARKWIGRREHSVDVVSHRIIEGLRTILEPGETSAAAWPRIPASIHWCLAPSISRLADLGRDGHPALGRFLPALPLPQRMWAGSELDFHDTLRAEDRIDRVSHVAAVDVKQGRTGVLCFVTVNHVFATARGPALTERQTIVYRDASAAQSPTVRAEAPAPAQWQREIHTDSVLLFRYSALTFNSHRIHYDLDYARHEEGYPGLVVHGPLQASYLLEFATELRASVPRHFNFRALAPAFQEEPLTLNAQQEGAGLRLWVANAAGRTTVQASATW